MLSIAQQLAARFAQAIQDALGVTSDPLIGLSQNEKFGDYQSNAAMGLAKQITEKTGQKTNPRAIAEQIKAKLDLGDMATEVSIAGPGFINVRLSPEWLSRQLASIKTDDRLGVPLAVSRSRVVVDYPSLNAAKESHIGHIRPMDIGETIARILRFIGHDVIPQNHLGDWGTAFGMLLEHLQSVGATAASQISSLDAFYKAAKKRFDEEPAFADAARAMVVKLQAGDPTARHLWQQILDATRNHLNAVFARLNLTVPPEAERGESFYNPMLQDTVNELKSLGIAELSEGATVVWVKGFEAPLIVQKTGGGFGYAATDLAAFRYRVRELKAQRLVYLTDARQTQHFAQWMAAARRAGWLTDDMRVDHVTFGTILGMDGKPFKTKSGESVKTMDVLDEAEERAYELVAAKNSELPETEKRNVARAVGIGAIKYFDLNKDRIGDYIFDWEKMLAMDGNTAPYLQYVYARVKSIFRKAGVEHGRDACVTMTLKEPAELALAKHILRLGEVIEIVGRELKPHHLCTYLYELATKFSSFYENCPVLQAPDEATRASRLALADLTARTMALGLDLLGIEHPEQM